MHVDWQHEISLAFALHLSVGSTHRINSLAVKCKLLSGRECRKSLQKKKEFSDWMNSWVIEQAVIRREIYECPKVSGAKPTQ